jgi:hypothetical protein
LDNLYLPALGHVEAPVRDSRSRRLSQVLEKVCESSSASQVDANKVDREINACHATLLVKASALLTPPRVHLDSYRLLRKRSMVSCTVFSFSPAAHTLASSCSARQ